MAQEEGFEPTMFVDTGKQEGEMSDETFFEILKERNPEMFEGMVEELNKMQRQGVEKQREEVTQVATEAQDAQEKQKRIQNSFLAAREE
jgi:membrane protease subunit (stomatin/prohibitin family)